MKTQEQIKQQVIDYLTKTSKHTFVKQNKNTEELSYFKVIKDDEAFKVLEDGKVKSLETGFFSIDNYVKIYGENAKNVFKNQLFLNKKMKSVKNNKFVKSEIDLIISGGKEEKLGFFQKLFK